MSKSVSRTRLAGLGLAALLLMSIPLGLVSAQEPEPEYVEPVAVADAETNYLEIDGLTGAMVTYVYNGVTETDVRVVNVAAEATGFNLLDPAAVNVWKDQVSSVDGFVEFWYTRLVAGDYVVTRTNSLGLEEIITTFSPPSVLTNNWIIDAACNFVSSVEATTLNTANTNNWILTPLLIVHAPHGGSATATNTWSSEKGVYSFGLGRTTTEDHTIKLSIPLGDGGKTQMVGRYAKWGYYERHYYTCGGGAQTERYAKVTSWSGTERQKAIWGSSTRSDNDDVEKECSSSGDCIYFFHRYRGSDRQIIVDCNTSGHSHSVSSRTINTLGASISISGKYLSANFFEARAGWGWGNTYDYFFPACGTWDVDFLKNSDQGWAFHRR